MRGYCLSSRICMHTQKVVKFIWCTAMLFLEALKAVSNIPYDEDAYILAQAARIICHSKKDTQNF